MGRLRTALQTLAMLEMPPAGSRCSSSIADADHRRAGTTHFAQLRPTRFYDGAVTARSSCRRRDLPPLRVTPTAAKGVPGRSHRASNRIGNGVVDTKIINVEGRLPLVLYTAGLVESPATGTAEGLDRLQRSSERGRAEPDQDIEDLCKTSLTRSTPTQAVMISRALIARSAAHPGRDRICFKLESELSAVRARAGR